MITALLRMQRRALICATLALLSTAACSGGGDAEKASDDAAAAPIAETPEAYREQSVKLRREGKYKEAMDAALKAFALAPPGPRVEERLELARANAASTAGARTSSDSSKAISGAINEIKSLEQEKRSQGVPVDEVHIAEVYALLGDANSVFRWLDRAVDAKSPNLASVENNPDFTAVHSDPRWLPLVARTK